MQSLHCFVAITICIGLVLCGAAAEGNSDNFQHSWRDSLSSKFADTERFGTSIQLGDSAPQSLPLHASVQACKTPHSSSWGCTSEQISLQCAATGLPAGLSRTPATAERISRRHFSRSRQRRQRKIEIKHTLLLRLICKWSVAIWLSQMQYVPEQHGFGLHSTAALASAATLDFCQHYCLYWMPVSTAVLCGLLPCIALCHWKLPVTGIQKCLHYIGEQLQSLELSLMLCTVVLCCYRIDFMPRVSTS